MNYTFRRGRIVTITWSHGGEICKVLARAGQIVYDTIKKDTRILDKEEYVVYNALWIKGSDFLVSNINGLPTPGFLVHGQHLRASTPYEKILRRKGINISPLVDSEESELILGEMIVSTIVKSYRIPTVYVITQITPYNIYIKNVMDNVNMFSKMFIKHNFRKATEYEEKAFKRSEKRFHTKKVLTDHI